MQGAQRRGPARQHQAAAGVAVEPVGELQVLPGPQRSQRLDDTEAHAAAAVHGHAGRLVHHQEPLVLVDDGGADACGQLG